jgi:hypothetical protein
MIVAYTGNSPQQRSNLAFLLGAYLCIEEGVSPDDAWSMFASLEPGTFAAFRDATFVKSTYDLSILDCLKVQAPHPQTPSIFSPHGRHTHANSHTHTHKRMNEHAPKSTHRHARGQETALGPGRLERSTVNNPCRDSIYSDWLQGLVKGQECGFIDIGENGSFNPAEYEYYDHPAHGDMHVIIPGKVRTL